MGTQWENIPNEQDIIKQDKMETSLRVREVMDTYTDAVA